MPIFASPASGLTGERFAVYHEVMKRFKKHLGEVLSIPLRWGLLAGIAVGLYFALGYFSGFNVSRPNIKGIAAVLGLRVLDGISLPKGLGSKGLGGLKLPDPAPRVVVRIALLADSHEDNRNLKIALDLAKARQADFAIHLGDFSKVGAEAELQLAKAVLDESELKYYALPGDHDLWASQGTLNFAEVFGEPYQAFEFKGIKFILLDNSDTARGLDEKQINWLKAELAATRDRMPVFVFAHIPPYHPSSPRAMGEKSTAVRAQAKELLGLLKEAGVKAIFCGDIHHSGDYADPDTGLKIHVVGALTTDRNLQTPRFSVLEVFEDGEYKVEEVEISN